MARKKKGAIQAKKNKVFKVGGAKAKAKAKPVKTKLKKVHYLILNPLIN